MGIRASFKYDNFEYSINLDQSFYWQHMLEMDNSLSNQNKDIWLEYIEKTGEDSDIRFMLSLWNEITDFIIC